MTVLICGSATAQINSSPADSAWVEQKLRELSLDEKLGQLFMVAAYSNRGEAHKEEILALIDKEKIGGLIFFKDDAQKQKQLTELYQSEAEIPLLIGMDAEWGLGMRLNDGFDFPYALTLGAVQDTALVRAMAKRIGEHCRSLGVHVNFAPVVDVNTNPKNPIINARSFGEDPLRVAEHALAYTKGLQDAGVMACAKHFPGHGDTDADSHKTLPLVKASLERMLEIEWLPYQSLIEHGLGSIMVAHLSVPALDSSGKASSLSPRTFVALREGLGFEGLAFTDALNMQGVAADYPVAIVDREAFLAGNDVLLFSQNVKLAKAELKKALKNGQFTEERLHQSLRRILVAKRHLIDTLPLAERTLDLQNETDQIINRRLYASAATLLLNREKILPLRNLGEKRIAVVTGGTEPGSHFVETLKKYASVNHFPYAVEREQELLRVLADNDIVIFGLYTSNASPWKSYQLPERLKNFVRKVSFQNQIIVDFFGNPYGLADFPQAESAQALMISYQNHHYAEEAAAQIIFGALGAEGLLPVSAGLGFKAGMGLRTEPVGRIGFALPGELGMDAQTLAKIDSVLAEALQQKATPGAQVLVLKEGKVVFERYYGYHTYQKTYPVNAQSIYDLASITKIAATVPLLMKLAEEDKIKLDQTLGHYLPWLEGSNKEDLVIREVLAHQARLQAWIPFFLETIEKGNYVPGYYNTERTFDFPHVVVEGLYSQRYIRDTILKRIRESPLRSKKEYKYSDLGYYLLKEIIEKIEGRPIDELAYELLYKPLGTHTMGFHPLQSNLLQNIVPTEKDELFRKKLVQGYVHDQGAALLGGVAGHAGLFSNAHDLAKLMQMYLQKGEYAGVRYFDSVTVSEFVRCQYCEDENRRGIGFDKPQLEGPGPTCGCVSRESFGHSGFTGTLAWADPQEEIVYIFLSNRVHPDANNRKLIELSTRTKIQELIYEALEHHSPQPGSVVQR